MIGAVLPFTPLGTYFGFVPPPAQFYLILAAMVAIYLVMVEVAKRGFYRWYRGSHKTRKRRETGSQGSTRRLRKPAG